MKNWLKRIGHSAEKLLITEDAGGIPVVSVPLSGLPDLLRTLRDSDGLDFLQLVDLFGQDNLPASPRFQISYVLHSPVLHESLILHVAVDSDTEIPSVYHLWPCAAWLERECHDLLGLSFQGEHMSRILLHEGFDGHPLRRNYGSPNRQIDLNKRFPEAPAGTQSQS